jgi:hypothetical protein
LGPFIVICEFQEAVGGTKIAPELLAMNKSGSYNEHINCSQGACMSSITAFIMLAAVGFMLAQVAPATNTRDETFTEADFHAAWSAEQARRGEPV